MTRLETNDNGTFNWANELLARDIDDDATDEYELVYNLRGDLTDDDQHYTYKYDAFGRLREVWTTGGSPDLVAEYRYNGLGHRIAWHYDVTDDGTTGLPDGVVDGDDPWYYMVYDESWRIVAVYRADDEDPKERYVYHAAGLDGAACVRG